MIRCLCVFADLGVFARNQTSGSNKFTVRFRAKTPKIREDAESLELEILWQYPSNTIFAT